MPFSTILTEHPFIRRLLQVRRRPLLCYAISVISVALATLIRWSFGPETGLPFITYFPAVTVTALIAGYRPAILSAIISVLIAPPLFGGDYAWRAGHPVVWTSLLFLLMVGIIIAVVALLHKALDQLVEQERNIRNLVETVPTGIVVVAQDGQIHLVNASAERLFGYGREELLQQKVERLMPERFALSHPPLREAFNRKPGTRPMGLGRELCGLRKDGSEFNIEVGLSPLLRETRRFTMATVIDVSERKRLQDKEKLLARELHHRTQNLFSVIQAIAMRILREGKTIDEARDDFLGRLRALATANQVLSSSISRGANLRDIIAAEMRGFPSQVDIMGCDVEVGAQVAQQFALILHELGTNAVKHGALSVPEGAVAISGALEDRVLKFSWIESGGPHVTEPSRRGFGSVILEQSTKSMGATVMLVYRPEGLLYECLLPLTETSDGA